MQVVLRVSIIRFTKSAEMNLINDLNRFYW